MEAGRLANMGLQHRSPPTRIFGIFGGGGLVKKYPIPRFGFPLPSEKSWIRHRGGIKTLTNKIQKMELNTVI